MHYNWPVLLNHDIMPSYEKKSPPQTNKQTNKTHKQDTCFDMKNGKKEIKDKLNLSKTETNKQKQKSVQ